MVSLKDYYGLGSYKGELGIGVEVESRRPLPERVTGWKATHDGSLRGYALE